jgi:hypothetical protein
MAVKNAASLLEIIVYFADQSGNLTLFDREQLDARP